MDAISSMYYLSSGFPATQGSNMFLCASFIHKVLVVEIFCLFIDLQLLLRFVNEVG
jgi:hypothetical protein